MLMLVCLKKKNTTRIHFLPKSSLTPVRVSEMLGLAMEPKIIRIFKKMQKVSFQKALKS